MGEIETVEYFNLLLFSNKKALENVVSEILHYFHVMYTCWSWRFTTS